MSRDVPWSFKSPSCPVEGCSEPGMVMSGGKCNFHDIIASARHLSPEQFDRLRTTLATTPPLTDEEHRVRRVRSALSRIEWTSRDFRSAKKAAKSAGATKGQIADAIGRFAE